MPKRLRQEIKGKEIVLSKGFEGCIWGFDFKEWKREAERQLEISAIEEKARLLRRYLFASSVTAEFDEQGRFVIPSSLLGYAGIKNEIVLIGAGDHFEVWERKLWQEHLKAIERQYGRVS